MMQVVSHIAAEILQPIGTGEGRNSTVFLARDLQLNGEVAVKEIPVESFDHPDEFFAEAQRLFAAKHARVIPLQYACRDEGSIRLVMPYFRNGSVQSYLDNHGPVPIRQVIKWAQQFLSGLHHIHIKGFVHFDIKPTNIMLGDDMSAMVADFGQTRPMDPLGLAVCPPMYIYHFPPEALTQRVASQQADIYQAGLALYRMVNGNDLFRRQIPGTEMELQQAILEGRFPHRDLFLAHVPRDLRTVIRKALSVDPAKRYQTTIDFMNSLGRVRRCLDWKYHSTDHGCSWVRSNASHTYCIQLNYDGDQWTVEGYTQGLGKALRRRERWCVGPFRTYRQAERQLTRIFSEEE